MEDKHYRFLVVVYHSIDGGILFRKSCQTISEAMEAAQPLKTMGDVIVQRVEHWVVN